MSDWSYAAWNLCAHTPHDAVGAYFDRIDAPVKTFITFERSAHFIMFEEPRRIPASAGE